MAITTWATATDPWVDAFRGPLDRLDDVETMTRFVTTRAWQAGVWPFLIGAMAWHLVVERRRPGRGPGGAGLWGDGWLLLGTFVVTSFVSSVSWPFPVTGAFDESARTFATFPAAAAANAILGICLLSALVVLGPFGVTRLAERRDAAALARVGAAGGRSGAASPAT